MGDGRCVPRAVLGRRFRGLIGGIVFLGLLSIALTASAASYVYDANGRLVAVTDTNGDSSQYVYDALGNLLSIANVPAGQLAIFTFSPNRGPVGTTVTITGQGFTAAAAVKFNGTVATVTSTSATQLIATVPAAATTGPLSVTVDAATVSSADNFVVISDDEATAPVIDSFTPTIADTGTLITVNGNHFVTPAGPTQAGVNDIVSDVTPGSNIQLAFPVPQQAGSGPVAVLTPYGIALSAQPLIVVPNGIGADNVVATSSLAIDGNAVSLNVDAAGKYAAATFEGAAGQWLSLQFDSLSTTPSDESLAVSLYGPNNELVESQIVYAQTLSMHLQPLARNGTYLVLFSPGLNASQAQFNVRLESDPAIGPDGYSDVAVTVAGQSKRVTFWATAGENAGIGLTDLNIDPGGYGAVSAMMLRPDDLIVGEAVCGNPGYFQCDDGPRNLIADTYGVVVGRYDQSVQTFSARVWASADLMGALQIGEPATVTTSNPAQKATYTFHGTAGQRLTLALDQVALGTGASLIAIGVRAPDGTCVLQDGTANCDLDMQSSAVYEPLQQLPVTGDYAVTVNPGGLYESQAATGSIRLTLSETEQSELPLDLQGGTPASTSVEGQQRNFTFHVATSGENLGLGLSDAVVVAADQQGWAAVEADVYDANGTRIGWTYCDSNCSLALPNMAAGDYLLVLKPHDRHAATFSVQVYLSHDIGGSQSVGTSKTITTESPGQQIRFTFDGVAGQELTLAVDQLVFGSGISYIDLSVYDPNGNCVQQFGSGTACQMPVTGTMYQRLAALPSTGTYTIVGLLHSNGMHESPVSARFTLSETQSQALPVDDSNGVTASTTLVGQQEDLTFSVATNGENLGLGLSNAVVVAGDQSGWPAVEADVYNPNGTQIGSTYCASNCSLALRNMAAGDYLLVLKPHNRYAATFSTQLHLSHDAVGSLVIGTPTTIATSIPGQNASYTFQATAGQNLTLAFSQVNLSESGASLSVQVFDPNGTSVATYGINGTSNPQLSISTSGTYTLYIAPSTAMESCSVQIDITAN